MRQEHAGRQAGGRNLGAVGRSQKKTWETETAERRQDKIGKDWGSKEEVISERAGRQEQQKAGDKRIREKAGSPNKQEKVRRSINEKAGSAQHRGDTKENMRRQEH
jgi:hypothetical protein